MSPPSWHDTMRIARPSLASVRHHRNANTFALFLVALLEHGAPLTLAEVADRFAAAGISDAKTALAALKRCRPGRPPAYREGDVYGLDPHDDELDLWVFRLGLRPAKVPMLRVVPPPPPPPPSSSTPLTKEELDLAWEDATLSSWSAARVTLAVLDAAGEALQPDDVVAAVQRRTRWTSLRAAPLPFHSGGGPVVVLADGRWGIREGCEAEVLAARKAVRVLVAKARERERRGERFRTGPAQEKHAARLRQETEERLLALRRAIVVSVPPAAPRYATVLDVSARTLRTFAGEDSSDARALLETYDVLAAVDVRAVLRGLGFDHGERRLADLAPPSDEIGAKLGPARTAAAHAAVVSCLEGSCGLRRPLVDPAVLARGRPQEVIAGLEANAKALWCLYQFGRLHGALLYRDGRSLARVVVPWAYRDEPSLGTWMTRALASGRELEVIVGRAPLWEDPWAGAVRAEVERSGPSGYQRLLFDVTSGRVIEEHAVQAVRWPLE